MEQRKVITLPEENPSATISYAFDSHTFIVHPVFKDNGAGTVGDILLRLMRADLEQS